MPTYVLSPGGYSHDDLQGAVVTSTAAVITFLLPLRYQLYRFPHFAVVNITLLVNGPINDDKLTRLYL